MSLLNFARMTVSGTPGTGSLTLNAAVAPFQSFATAGAVSGRSYSYVIVEGTTKFECGHGTYTSAGTLLSRDTVYDASAGAGTHETFTSACQVYITPLSADFLESFELAISDEATAITVATGVMSWFLPYDFTLTEVFLGLGAAQSSSGAVTADMKQNGTTVFTTKPSVGASQNTSLTGTGSVQAVLAITALSKGDKMTVDVSAAGTGAKGGKLVVIGRRT
jgi:hypothetical protein